MKLNFSPLKYSYLIITNMNIQNPIPSTPHHYGNKFQQHVVNTTDTIPQTPHGTAAIRLGSVWF